MAPGDRGSYRKGSGPASLFLFLGNPPNTSSHSSSPEPKCSSNMLVFSLKLQIYRPPLSRVGSYWVICLTLVCVLDEPSDASCPGVGMDPGQLLLSNSHHTEPPGGHVAVPMDGWLEAGL